MHTFAHIINQTPPVLGKHNGAAIKRPLCIGLELAGPLLEGYILVFGIFLKVVYFHVLIMYCIVFVMHDGECGVLKDIYSFCI